MNSAIYTIGHSTHPISYFCELLSKYGIEAVADVRSTPFSRFKPQYNRHNLEKSLEDVGISYVWLGRELGARSEDPNCYVDGKISYDLLAKSELFIDGLERLRHGMARFRIALMCAERDPLTCHRTILVSRRLAASGVRVGHILDDGELESHEAVEERLLSETKMPRGDLFLSREQLLAMSYKKKEDLVAYRPTGCRGDSSKSCVIRSTAGDHSSGEKNIEREILRFAQNDRFGSGIEKTLD